MAADRFGRMVAALGGGVLVSALLIGCTVDRESGVDADAAVLPATETTTTVTGAPIEVTLPGTLAADFQLWKADIDGRAGMAVMPVGGTRPVVFGDWTSGPAWSTIKVPLVIAAQRANANASTYSINAAVTASDNTAADALWQGLGGGKQAAQAIEAVLREAGDSTTAVPATRPRPEHSAFGQSEWSLTEQIRFAAKLPCLPGAQTVLELMGEIIPDHQWGLGTVTGANFKGGWGPDTSGNYLVRQFGIIDGPGGRIAVALAAEPESGSFADGMAALNGMAELVSQHLDELAGGSCPS
ncbi:class A beta-lactamase-related serine hydrolase [Nocardia higoensis]|nr:class A beta-lactamase-related serine hydrolase [Nocardia higoensis]